jgi:hypothetical protein
MLGPDGPHLLVGRELTAVSGSLGASNRLALFGRKNYRRRKIGACKLHDGARYVILIVGRQATHDLHSFIEELCHFRNIWSGWVEVENRSREALAGWREADIAADGSLASSPDEGVGAGQKKSPAFRQGLLHSLTSPGLAVLIRHFLPLTIGVRLLTTGILLLLARLLAATLLLLTGLLTRVLVLLARVVLIGHWGISVFGHSWRQRRAGAFVAGEHQFRRDHCAAKAWQDCEAGTAAAKTSSVQAN